MELLFHLSPCKLFNYYAYIWAKRRLHSPLVFIAKRRKHSYGLFHINNVARFYVLWLFWRDARWTPALIQILIDFYNLSSESLDFCLSQNKFRCKIRKQKTKQINRASSRYNVRRKKNKNWPPHVHTRCSAIAERETEISTDLSWMYQSLPDMVRSFLPVAVARAHLIKFLKLMLESTCCCCCCCCYRRIFFPFVPHIICRLLFLALS